MPDLPNEIFISHSHRDLDFVKQLAEVLRRHALPFWHSERNILGAQQWHDEIGRALARCDWFVLVLSPHAVDSRWVKHELLFALNESHYEDHIMPLVYQPCNHAQLSWTLASFQMIDFTASFADACREVLRVWGVGYHD